MQVPLFYRQKAICAVDIGHSTVKVVQLKKQRGKVKAIAFGYTLFPVEAMHEGELVKPELLVKTLNDFIKHGLYGKVSTDRIVVSVPSARTFTRLVTMPKMKSEDLAAAIQTEAERYIPVPNEQLYIEHTRIPSARANTEEEMVLIAAIPKKIIDSYLDFVNKSSFEVAAFEPSLFAIMRAVDFAAPSSNARVVIDFGAMSSDLAIYQNSIQLTSTVNMGGEHVTEAISKTLAISYEQANKVKMRYGIAKSPWQIQLAKALQPILSELSNEIQKLMRYHIEHSLDHNPINEIAITGGGANLPGLANFLSQLTGCSVVIANPWSKIKTGSLPTPPTLETTIYGTAIGLALKEVTK